MVLGGGLPSRVILALTTVERQDPPVQLSRDRKTELTCYCYCESRYTKCVADNDVARAGHLREVIPLQLETVSCGGRCTRGADLNQIHGMGTRRYILSVDNDNEFSSQCE